MKKALSLVLVLTMVFALFAVGHVSAYADGMDDLIATAKAEGELVVYGSCEEEYLAAACETFQKLYLTSGLAVRTTPMTAWPRRASWTTPMSLRMPLT